MLSVDGLESCDLGSLTRRASPFSQGANNGTISYNKKSTSQKGFVRLTIQSDMLEGIVTIPRSL